MSIAPKPPDYFDDFSPTDAIIGKTFEGEILIQIQITTPLQIFCKLKINSKVIFSVVSKVQTILVK